MKNVFLIRGVPGVSKSSTARQIVKDYDNYAICEADDYFIRNGIYERDIKKLNIAHSECKRKFARSLLDNLPCVIQSNTNIKWDELKDYILYAGLAKYSIYLVEPNPPWKDHIVECYRKCIHKVDLNSICRMALSYQPNSHIIEQAKIQFNITIKEFQ